MNEKIKEIAEFDGWEPEHPLMKYADGSSVIAPQPPYLTDLNALHRVALDVANKLSSENMIIRLHNAMLYRPINGQYTDLVDAIYDAIVYLKKCENGKDNIK